MGRSVEGRGIRIVATATVAIHALVLIAHSLAHLRLEIFLPAIGNLYVITVIVIAPIVAGILFWTAYQRSARWLLLASMFGALVFGGIAHFVAHSPDNISQVPSGGWGSIFTVSAVVMAFTEAIACGVAVWALAKVDSPTA